MSLGNWGNTKGSVTNSDDLLHDSRRLCAPRQGRPLVWICVFLEEFFLDPVAGLGLDMTLWGTQIFPPGPFTLTLVYGPLPSFLLLRFPASTWRRPSSIQARDRHCPCAQRRRPSCSGSPDKVLSPGRCIFPRISEMDQESSESASVLALMRATYSRTNCLYTRVLCSPGSYLSIAQLASAQWS